VEQQQFWVGLGFAAAFVLFLMLAFLREANLNSGQRLILRILSAICGALSGALISGSALFNMTENVPGGKITVSGVAGFAVFMIIWFTFPREPKRPDPVDGTSTSIPAGATFQSVADELAKDEECVLQYEGFRADELSATLKAWKLKGANAGKCIESLGSITQVPNAVRQYRVKKEGSKYRLIING
jgi:hypothetical protein